MSKDSLGFRRTAQMGLSNMRPDIITTPQNHRIAYRQTSAAPGKPSYIWLSGLNSDMTGSKVSALESWASETGSGFLAFDYSGHGLSDGDFADGTISDWRDDTLAVIDELTSGKQILIGSSMGAWLALLAALARPDRISGLVLIAPAPDFTEKLIWPDLSPEAQAEIMQAGVHMHPSDYGEPYPITRALIEDGKRWQLLDTPIEIAAPVRILQGMDDADVPWQHAQRLTSALTSDDLTFTLVKGGNHSLSRPTDITRLKAVCVEIAGPASS